MQDLVVADKWVLTSKLNSGELGYVFEATSATMGAATASTVVLTVRVVEERSQRIYFYPNGDGGWTGLAFITPVENVALDAATAEWRPGVPLAKAFAVDFQPEDSDRTDVIVGTLPVFTAKS